MTCSQPLQTRVSAVSSCVRTSLDTSDQQEHTSVGNVWTRPCLVSGVSPTLGGDTGRTRTPTMPTAVVDGDWSDTAKAWVARRCPSGERPGEPHS